MIAALLAVGTLAERLSRTSANRARAGELRGVEFGRSDCVRLTFKPNEKRAGRLLYDVTVSRAYVMTIPRPLGVMLMKKTAFALMAAAIVGVSANGSSAADCAAPAPAAPNCCCAPAKKCLELPKLKLPQLKCPEIKLPKLDLCGLKPKCNTCAPTCAAPAPSCAAPVAASCAAPAAHAAPAKAPEAAPAPPKELTPSAADKK